MATVANYPVVAIRGLEGEQLIVHMCHPLASDEDMVEVHTAGGTCVVLTRQQFNQMVDWVNNQFDVLSKVVRTIH